MNANQRQNVINIIEEIKSLDLDAIFVANFKDEPKPENVSAGDISVLELFTLTNRMLVQLEARVKDSSFWFMLPYTQNFNNDFASSFDLHSYLSNFKTYISRADFTSAATMIKALIYYQIINGFWNIPIKDESVINSEINDTQSRLSLLTSHLEARRSSLEETSSEVATLKAQLNEFIETKNSEYRTLSDNLEESANIIENIKERQENIDSIQTETQAIKANCAVIDAQINTLLDNSKEELSKIEESYSSFVEESTTSLSDAESKLNIINQDHENVASIKEEVKKMMGYISDGTLSHSFNSRKKDIDKATTTWLVVSIVSAILMGAWIFIVFTFLKANTGNIIADMIISAVKTTPMIALFWFSLKQYSKERNLLEEYAFREAIAVTLTAYSEQIENVDSENIHKIDLLRETVDKLYTKPQITSNETLGLFSIKSKDLVELTKEIREVVAEIKVKK